MYNVVYCCNSFYFWCYKAMSKLALLMETMMLYCETEPSDPAHKYIVGDMCCAFYSSSSGKSLTMGLRYCISGFFLLIRFFRKFKHKICIQFTEANYSWNSKELKSSGFARMYQIFHHFDIFKNTAENGCMWKNPDIG